MRKQTLREMAKDKTLLLPVVKKINVVFDWTALSDRERKIIIEALQNGCIFSMSGIAHKMYMWICEKYGIPATAICRQKVSAYNKISAWYVWTTSRSTKEFDGLLATEAVARKMSDNKEQYQAYYGGPKFRTHYHDNSFAYFCEIKHKESFIEVCKQIIAPHVSNIGAAIKEVSTQQEITVTYTH